MSFRRPVRIALVFPFAAACGLLACAMAAAAQSTGGTTETTETTETPAASTMRMAVDGSMLSTQATPPAARPAATEPNGKSTPTRPTLPEAMPPRSVGPPVVEEVRPELYYLKNKDGDLEPVLGFTYEDFYRLYRLEQRLLQGAKPPAFRFEQATLAGKVENGRAELSAELRIVTTEAGWVRVPLGLSSAVLAEPPKPQDNAQQESGPQDKGPQDNHSQHSGAGDAESPTSKQMLLLDANDGYVLWLNGEEGQTHTVRLERLLFAVESNGDESRLRISLPRALATADVQLSVPLPDAKVKTSDTATVVSTKAAAASTDVAITARGGDLQVSWRGGAPDSAAATRVVEATSAVRATIDDRSILWEAQVTVQSLRGTLDAFDVRLPVGAELDPVAPGGYVVSVSGDSPRVVSFALAKSTTEPVTVRLVCRRMREASNGSEEVDFAGFGVVDAARQSGALVVAIDGDWRVEWQRRADVREAEQPPEPLAPPDDQQAFAFKFFRQPFALVGRISPQPTRLDVEPQYQVTVEADRLLLTARMMYKVRGAKVSSVQLRMPGWDVDEIGPPGMIHASGAVRGDDGTLTVPLAQRMRSAFEVTLQASQALPADATRVDFVLPNIVADAIAPPVLVVDVADNVDLMPVEAETTQLSARSGPPPSGMTSEKRRHPPLVYRVLGEGQVARFVADRTIRSRELFVESATDVRVERGVATVEQRLDLRVAYEALNRIVLDLPAGLAGRRDVSFSIDGETVLPIALASGDSASPSGNGVPSDAKTAANQSAGRAKIALEPPVAVLDRAQIVIRHTIAAPTDADKPLVIPLVMPGDAAVLSNVVRVASTGAATYVGDAAWTQIVPAAGDAPNGVEFRASGRADAIGLRMSAQPRRTTVHAMWIRTTAAGELRQDRVAFRVETDERRLLVALPEGARADRVAVWVDHEVVAPSVFAAGSAGQQSLRAQIDLPTRPPSKSASAAAESQFHTVEILYDIAGESNVVGRRSWQAPRVLGDVWQARTWWEVVVPQGEHVAIDPGGFTPEYAWRWNAAMRWGDTPILPVLGRRPNLSTAELQQLTGAAALDTAGQANRYLYSASGPVERIEFQTLPRWMLVMIGSGAAIAVGLLIVYAPLVRRAGVLIAGGVAVVGIAVWSPTAAILAGQAAAVGLLLAIAAGVVSWWLGGRGKTPAPSSTHSASVERGSSASRRRRGESPQATTLTAPAEFDVADINT